MRRAGLRPLSARPRAAKEERAEAAGRRARYQAARLGDAAREIWAARPPMSDVDLFGEPVMQRDATFLREGVRLTLSRTWGPGPRALVCGCNPADANALLDDMTSN